MTHSLVKGENIDDRVLVIEMDMDYTSEEAIERLHHQFQQAWWTRGENRIDFKPNDEKSVFYMIYAFKKLCQGKTSGKLLDLGSGEGFMLATFTLAGYDCYGIEKDSEMAGLSKIKLSTLPRPPQIIQGNYFDPAFRETAFPDGARISDMDFIVCHSYNGGHWLDVFMNVLLKAPIKIGALVDLGYYIGHPNQNYASTGRMYHNSGFITPKDLSHTIMKKINEPNEIALKEIEVINRWLNEKTEYRRKTIY